MNTKHAFLAIFALVSTTSALAIENDPRPKLKQLFDSGAAPKESEVRSIWVGRCYDAEDNNLNTYGGLLIGQDNRDRNGPLFDGQNRLHVDIHTSSHPEYFDNFHAKQYRANRDGGVDLDEDEDSWSSDRNAVSKTSAYEKNGAIEQPENISDSREYLEGNEYRKNGLNAWRIRKNGKYLIAEFVTYFDRYKTVTKGPFWNSYKDIGAKFGSGIKVGMTCYFYEDLL